MQEKIYRFLQFRVSRESTRTKIQKKTPKISGIVFLKPKFTALVERIILLGPGVIAAVIAKVKIGAIK